MTQHAWICDAIRTPFGRYGGAGPSIRTDDLGAVALKAPMAPNAHLDWQAIGSRREASPRFVSSASTTMMRGVNLSGGALVLGQPPGASGALLTTAAMSRRHRSASRLTLCVMRIGVGQGIALVPERI